jgi:hypothetical protein
MQTSNLEPGCVRETKPFILQHQASTYQHHQYMRNNKSLTIT